MMVPQWCCEVFIENKHDFREYTAWHHVVYLQSKYTQASIINVIMTASNYCLTNIEIDCPSRQKKQLFIFRKHTTSDLQLVLGVFFDCRL